MKVNNFGIVIFAIALLVNIFPLKAQDIQIHVNYLQGIRYTGTWNAFKGGTELSADYLISQNKMKYSGGIDLRTVQWGNQASISLGAFRSMSSRLEIGGKIHNGIAIFWENPLYVLGLEAKSNYIFLQKGKYTLGVSLGLRYSYCPGYQEHSSIYNLLEVPMGLLVRF